MADDEPIEWLLKSRLFRCILNSLMTVDCKQLINAKTNNVFTNIINTQRNDLFMNWEGGTVYFPFEITPMMQHFLENIRAIFKKCGALPIHIPAFIICDKQQSNLNVICAAFYSLLFFSFVFWEQI